MGQGEKRGFGGVVGSGVGIGCCLGEAHGRGSLTSWQEHKGRGGAARDVEGEEGRGLHVAQPRKEECGKRRRRDAQRPTEGYRIG